MDAQEAPQSHLTASHCLSAFAEASARKGRWQSKTKGFGEWRAGHGINRPGENKGPEARRAGGNDQLSLHLDTSWCPADSACGSPGESTLPTTILPSLTYSSRSRSNG